MDPKSLYLKVAGIKPMGGVRKWLCNEPWPAHAASALLLTAYPNTGSATALLPYSFHDRLYRDGRTHSTQLALSLLVYTRVEAEFLEVKMPA